MPPIDPQLVQQIAQQVLRAMRQNGTPPAPAPINPPLGQCPGAGELPDTPTRPQPATPVTTSIQAQVPEILPLPATPVLDGLITANQLDDAIASSPDGNIILAPTARLTPLAQDRTRREPHRFQRTQTAQPHAATLATINHGQPWLWWTCGRCPAVQRVTEERRQRLLPIAAPREPIALPVVLRDLSNAIESGRAAGGILFVASAAKPLCLANRLRPLRAVHAHCEAALRQGIRDVGANVLILEFPFLDHDRMAAHTDQILASSPAIPPAIAHALLTVEGARA
ncbi:hypothetical protein [Mucisphaera sp.]|uniref:hypothetical protein n=1 Tax=Mucisphaera sp. TaxID=2913024 RepID=UPI003D148A7C